MFLSFLYPARILSKLINTLSFHVSEGRIWWGLMNWVIHVACLCLRCQWCCSEMDWGGGLHTGVMRLFIGLCSLIDCKDTEIAHPEPLLYGAGWWVEERWRLSSGVSGMGEELSSGDSYVKVFTELKQGASEVLYVWCMRWSRFCDYCEKPQKYEDCVCTS